MITLKEFEVGTECKTILVPTLILNCDRGRAEVLILNYAWGRVED